SSRRRHTRFSRDWSSDVCSSDLGGAISWSANPYVGVTLGYNGGDISWSDDIEVDDVNYDVDMDNNLTYLNAEIRPWANWFYVARSEERRVGKEGDRRGSGIHENR